MKYTNFKTWALMLSASALLALSGCDSSSGVSYVVEDVTPPVGVTPPSTEPAEGELGYQTILANGDIEYVDYTGDTRVSPPSAADAEYHTAKGYGNTLFDSADKKCQNCHNELYDTWKGSMHGKSWADPIFQSKFQDFLRTHLAKIGEDKSGSGTAPNNGIVYEQASVGVGTKNMFSGAAQTCIKCHAPGAYYAGDVQVTVTEVQDATNVSTSELDTLKASLEVNDSNGEIAVIAANKHQNKIYKATFQIGHEANREGINCAFCHSIETPRLMRTVADGAMDNAEYTLANTMRVGPHGPVKNNVGDILAYDVNASSRDMNHFFRLWGPEKYANYAHTPKGGTADPFDVGKAKDGRYTMHSTDLNGTDGKVHFTGGPFYGPFGVTGKTNENETDESDRTANINPHFDKDNNNHFSESGKGLCLSCHQRSAGASLTGSTATNFMELCSTQIAVSTNGPLGQDTGANDTESSPKCQKCHMERIEGTVLHKWARPDLMWTLADVPGMVPELDPDTTTVPAGEAPVRDGWLNSHAFLGASKTGHKTSATAKIQSGFEGSISTSVSGTTLTVTTTFTNKTAHMFPGAHPMRRVLSRVIVTDGTGAMIPVLGLPLGTSTFGDITNTVQPLQGKVLHESTSAPVPVNENGSAALSFPGKVPDLNGPVSSQKFSGLPYIIEGTDSTISDQTVTNGVTEGNVTNAAIVNSTDLSNFTRVYGHETGKEYSSVFIVRPGFDSNMVESDNRLSPNETETYTITYDITGLSGVSATYKIYYMQKGANGKFIVDPATGFLDQAASDAKKLLVTEVGNYPAKVN